VLRRIGIIAVLSLIVVALTASVALAHHRPGHGTTGTGNPHYVVGPDITVDNATVTATGSIAGLGSESITAVLTVTGFQEVQCQNPGGNIAPGQTKELTAVGEQRDIRVEQGRATFNVSATLQATQAELQAACPNPKWTPIPGDVVVTGYTLQIFQAGQELTQLRRSATF
jgi:hypothetical protein